AAEGNLMLSCRLRAKQSGACSPRSDAGAGGDRINCRGMPVRLYASAGPELTHYDVEVENAELTRRDTISLPANVHYAWPHASGRYLYVASSNSAAGIGGFVGANHSISALRIDPASGDLSPHGAPLPLPT